MRNRFLATIIKFKQPPILILSYPRSGSSWVGEILGKSENAAYLREPITRAYLTNGGTFALIDLNDRAALSSYKKYGDESFMGLPSKIPGVVNNYRDFGLLKRRNRKLLIKEVNPRAAEFFCKRYKPRTIFLLRHPAAVALSFSKIGWLKSKDTQMETGNRDANEWEKFGFAYGCIIKEALKVLREDSDFEVFCYEEIVKNPEEEFRRMFIFSEMRIPSNFDNIIESYCKSEGSDDPYEVMKISSDMVNKWKYGLTSREISSIKMGYVQSGLEYYSKEEDWETIERWG